MDIIKVSVIIPTYKRAEMLPRAIDSVLEQSYKNIEVVVVDDNNPDTEWRKITEKLMQPYETDSRVQYIKHTKNSNGAVARNTGIKFAKGDIVTFLDDDDLYNKRKIEKQVEYLINHSENRAVYCGWDRDGVCCPKLEGDLSYYILSGDQIIYTNAIMMWKDNAVQCGGWDETFQRHQEAAFLLRYFYSGYRIGVVPECLIKFDTSDRSNVANPVTNERHMDHYLMKYNYCIKKCEIQKRGSEKRIFTHRYRGVILNYFKSKEYKNAIRVYWKWMKKYPVAMPVAFMSYFYERILKQ